MRQSLQKRFLLRLFNQSIGTVREPFVFIIDGKCPCKQAQRSSLFRQVSGRQKQRVCHVIQRLVLRLGKFSGRKIGACLQQFKNSLCRTLPCDGGAVVAVPDAGSAGKVDAVLHEPHGVFASVILDAASVFFAKLPFQKCDGFFFRALPHIECSNAVGAAKLIAGSVERLVNDGLRHFLGRKQAGLGRLVVIRRRCIAQSEQGHLLCHDRGVLQAQLDFVFAALNEVFRHFGDDTP